MLQAKDSGSTADAAPSAVPLLLALDTSSRRGSLALLAGARPVAFYGADTTETHSTRLLSEIDLLITKTGNSLIALDAFVVVNGPGSFTGLRLGLSTVKGLARAANKPIIAVTALEATARTAGAAEVVLAFVNALRQEVYAQLFQVTLEGAVQPLSEAIVAPPATVLARFGGHANLVLAGDGTTAYHREIESFAQQHGHSLHWARIHGDTRPGWTVAPIQPFLAMEAAILGVDRWQRGETVDPQQLDAFYVRASDAELKLGQREQA